MLDSVHIEYLEKISSNDFQEGRLSNKFYDTKQKIIAIVTENNCSIWELKLITDYITEVALVKSAIKIDVN